MPTRSLSSPNFDARRVGDDVQLLFYCPGSKFGRVQVLLEQTEAEELLHQLVSATASFARVPNPSPAVRVADTQKDGQR